MFMAGARITGPVNARVQRGEEIVCDSVREFRDEIGRGGSDYQDVILLCNADVLDRT